MAEYTWRQQRNIDLGRSPYFNDVMVDAGRMSAEKAQQLGEQEEARQARIIADPTGNVYGLDTSVEQNVGSYAPTESATNMGFQAWLQAQGLWDEFLQGQHPLAFDQWKLRPDNMSNRGLYVGSEDVAGAATPLGTAAAAAAAAAIAPPAAVVPDFVTPAAAPYVAAPFGRGGSGARTAQLMQALAMNQYAREQSGREQTSAFDEMGRRFGDMRRQISGGMNRRGMLDSGQRDRAWRRSYTDELREANKLGSAFDAQRFQSDLNDFAAEGQYATGALGALQDDVTRRAADAATIRAARV